MFYAAITFLLLVETEFCQFGVLNLQCDFSDFIHDKKLLKTLIWKEFFLPVQIFDRVGTTGCYKNSEKIR